MIIERTFVGWAVIEGDGNLFGVYTRQDAAQAIAAPEEGDRVVECSATIAYDDSAEADRG